MPSISLRTRASAISPQCFITSDAVTAASNNLSGAAPQYTPASEVSIHPAPVMRRSSSLPPHSTAVRFPSVITSIAPVSSTTVPVRCAKSRSHAADSARLSSSMRSLRSASTPLSCPVPPASARISDTLPRMTETRPSARSFAHISPRKWLAPAATGSSTTGWPSFFAVPAARSMASCARTAPMLRTSEEACAVISSTSRSSCAMIAVPPAARMIFAQSLTVTGLVMQWVIGRHETVLSITFFSSSINAEPPQGC